MKQISLLVCGINFPPETFLDRLLGGLAQAGVEVTLACDQKPGPAWLGEENRRWLWAPGWDGSNLDRLLNSAGLLRYLPKWNLQALDRLARNGSGKAPLRERYRAWYQHLPFGSPRWDVVYFPWLLGAEPYLGWLVQANLPLVVSLRGSMVTVGPHTPGRKAGLVAALGRIFARSAAVHCVSQDILEEALPYGLDPAKARVIRPAVDPGFFGPPAQKMPNPRFTVVTTGSLVWVKGYEYALLAVRALADRGLDAEFHILGEGPERSRILYTVEDLGLQERVFLHGKLTPAQVRDRLQRADAFLLSSLSEGISNAALEAMACGLPVVTTGCGGMREAVADGVDGFVVPVRDPAAAAAALERLALDGALRRRLGEAARRKIIQSFSLDQQVAQYIDLFHQAAKMGVGR